ncbi:hypothetical protein PV08_10554 [Exophiala spinifera]|uniref:Btz domain-containing protein n=1 Tax=Exophiala spinifera TaxID=91928 RepID=A0A0D2BIR8_9EURO|nr:uncharacterized protein PV08_10554 [Exophiala spinifera]KIW11254.1 hypothetical protein PV08_10554 [Exophiala spinifera]
MPALRRKDLLSRRRRRADEGEDDGSIAGDYDDSSSEDSAVSDGDDEAEAEGSESSGDEHEPTKSAAGRKAIITEQENQRSAVNIPQESDATSNGAFTTSAETQAMLHGLGRQQHPEEMEQVDFDDLHAGDDAASESAAAAPRATRNETPAQRSLREHQEYIQQRNTNPAFVPNRGKFFLHDDRTAASNGALSRPLFRGRGRGYASPMNAGRGFGINEPTDRPWAHDLHEGHELGPSPVPSQTQPVPGERTTRARNSPAAALPNRSFSFTTVLGNVSVQISFPGMEKKKIVSNVVKKHHTLLPQHRPPLRRDKPVRISIPDQQAKYVFPSTERSFIFIPRAMRPNQQNYHRGRGRGSFHGSRRPSVYGSVYTPSIAMSRKSSIGGSTMRDGIRSPADSVISRMGASGMEFARPIVRMPSGVPTPSVSRTGMPIVNGPMGLNTVPPNIPPPPFYGSHSTAIPMHQPRPQKTVSVADIESPAAYSVKAPQQQQDLPFHQQVPAHMAASQADERVPPAPQTLPGMAGTTPLSQIPEGAVFAQGFQPYPVMGGPGYFTTPYANGLLYYPGMGGNGSFSVPITGPAMAPSFIPGSQAHPVNYVHAPGPAEGGTGNNLMAHESNGMVYYYNPPAYPTDSQGGFQQYPSVAGNVMPMANGLPSQPLYYPGVSNGMFYPAQTG